MAVGSLASPGGRKMSFVQEKKYWPINRAAQSYHARLFNIESSTLRFGCIIYYRKVLYKFDIVLLICSWSADSCVFRNPQNSNPYIFFERVHAATSSCSRL